MPNPRTRLSKARKRSRRTHDKVELPQLKTCQTTGEVHRYHNAYFQEGNMYYKGNLVIKAKED